MTDSYSKWFKLTKEMQNSINMVGTMHTAKELEKSVRALCAPLDVTIRKSKAEISFLEEVSKSQKFLGDISITKLNRVVEETEMFSSFAPLEVEKSMKQFTDAMCYFKHFQTMFEGNELQRLGKIFQATLSCVKWVQGISVDELAEDIIEQYIEEETENSNQELVNTQKQKIDKEKLKQTIGYWFNLIASIVTILTYTQALVSSQPTVNYNTYNNITEVNYNYTIEAGIDAEYMNYMGYRIINQNNIMPRIKPDCSSRVTGHLYIGQIVNVSDKWKKWIEITWKDEKGNYCSGWIQNYKASRFK